MEEEEFKPHSAYAHFAYSHRARQEAREAPPLRAKKSSSRGEEIENCLHSLADRLEALEIGLKELTRVRNSSAPTFKSRILAKNAPTKKHYSSSCGLFKTSTPSTPSSPSSHIDVEQNHQTEKICQGGEGGEDEALKISTSSFNDDINVENFYQQRICHGSGKTEMSPDTAALIIQTRFRAYLARRSQTLRHLRDLAMIKSEFKQLNFLFANAGYRRIVRRDQDERRRFCEKAVGLLLKLDSIEGTDGMIREARRSLSKKVVALLDSVDNEENDDDMDVIEDVNKKTRRGLRGHRQSKKPLPSIMDDPVRMSDNCCESCPGQQTISLCSPGDSITDANNDDGQEGEEDIVEGLGDWRRQVTGRGPSSFSATGHPLSKNQWRPKEFNMPTSAYTNTSSRNGPRKKIGLHHCIQRDFDER